jgi:hypothetical protein
MKKLLLISIAVAALLVLAFAGWATQPIRKESFA